MRIGRKLPAAAAVIGLAAGLTLVGPSLAGAQGPIQVGCKGVPGSEAETLINGVPDLFPGGVVPIPVTINAEIPAELAPGASSSVSFGWTLDPGSSLTGIATSVGGITSIDAELLQVSVTQSGGSGGPYPFTPTAVIQFLPTQSFPEVTASGQVTAGDAPIGFNFSIGLLDLTIVTPSGTQVLNLDCAVSGESYIGGIAVGGVAPTPDGGDGGSGSGSGGGGGASTTIGRGTTGTASARVTG